LRINIIWLSYLTYKTLFIKRKIIADLELKLKSEENQLINDNKSYYLELAELQEEKNKINSDLPNYELRPKENRIKIQNYKPKLI
jgi:inner membrane protein